MKYQALIKSTSAYKIVLGDKKAGTLSHAYLILSPDKKYLREYLRLFAKLIMCEDFGEDNCRTCNLIDAERHADVKFIPEIDKDKTLVSDIENLIEDSYVKPFEGDKKLYVICGAEQMTVAAQNKLLKTLEEPPKGVHILLGATSEYPLLQTVKSRVKTLTIPLFSNEVLYGVLENEYEDKDKLKIAIAGGDGTLGRAEELYSDEKLSLFNSLAVQIITEMKTSRDVLEYSSKILKYKDNLKEFVECLSLAFRDMLVEMQGEKPYNPQNAGLLERSTGFTEGSLLNALEITAEAVKRISFNANDVMLVDWLLFAILEGKYKWQKL